MTGTKRLTSISAFLVARGDELEVGGERVAVTGSARGANGQRYVVTQTAGGAPVVHEFDPGQRVSVWR